MWYILVCSCFRVFVYVHNMIAVCPFHPPPSSHYSSPPIRIPFLQSFGELAYLGDPDDAKAEHRLGRRSATIIAGPIKDIGADGVTGRKSDAVPSCVCLIVPPDKRGAKGKSSLDIMR